MLTSSVGALQASNIPMPLIKGSVHIDSVDFRYSLNGPQILNNVSLDVPTGTFVGMVGGSGSGKSTLLKILTGTMLPTRLASCRMVATLESCCSGSPVFRFRLAPSIASC